MAAPHLNENSQPHSALSDSSGAVARRPCAAILYFAARHSRIAQRHAHSRRRCSRYRIRRSDAVRSAQRWSQSLSARPSATRPHSGPLHRFTVVSCSLAKAASQGPAVLADLYECGTPRAHARYSCTQCRNLTGVRSPGRRIRPPVPSVSCWQRPRCFLPTPPCARPLRPLRLPLVHPEARSNNQQRSRISSISNGSHSQTSDGQSSATERTFPGARSTTFSPGPSALAAELQAFKPCPPELRCSRRARTPNGVHARRASTAPRAAETRAECPADGVPTPARSCTRSRERQSSTACAVPGRQFDTGRRNPNRPGLAGSARLVAHALTKVRFESTARARPRSFL